MIHKFISNDNQGNVNTLEIGSDYTKISKVVDPVNDDDVANKKYVDQAAGKFIVTLTLTAADYSGTMDKTVAEINAAYEAGQEIWFKIVVGSDWTEYPLSRVGKLNAFEYPSFNCNALYDELNVLVMIYTGITNDGTKQTYAAKVYSLTPAS